MTGPRGSIPQRLAAILMIAAIAEKTILYVGDEVEVEAMIATGEMIGKETLEDRKV
jgi:hypothetical protein